MRRGSERPGAERTNMPPTRPPRGQWKDETRVASGSVARQPEQPTRLEPKPNRATTASVSYFGHQLPVNELNTGNITSLLTL
jgi:hypothetical protein